MANIGRWFDPMSSITPDLRTDSMLLVIMLSIHELCVMDVECVGIDIKGKKP